MQPRIGMRIAMFSWETLHSVAVGGVAAHVTELAADVLRHRLILSYEGIAAGVTPDVVVGTLLQRFPPPRIDLGDRHVA